MKRPANAKTRPETLPWPRFGFSPVAVGFLALFFLYVRLRIEPALEYEHSAPAFRFSSSFLSPFLSYPGGWVEYGAAFLAQLNYHHWLGALVFTLMGGLAFAATRQVMSRLSNDRSSWASYGPPFLLLLLRDRYDSPALVVTAGWLAAMGCALALAGLPWRQPWLRLVGCWGLAALLFYVAGLWSCLLFVVLSSGSEFRREQDWRWGFGCGLSAAVAALGVFWLREDNLARLLNPWGKGWPLVPAAALHLFCPVAALVLALRPRSGAVLPSGRLVRRATSPGSQAGRWLRKPGPRRAFALGLLLLGWAWVWLAFDGQRKLSLQIEYYTRRKAYEKVLATATGLKALSPPSEIRLHLALYHTGRLGQDLFSCTNQTGWDLLPALRTGLESCRAQSETLLEMGHVNLAEHFAHEALEYEGDRPEILRRLARINVLRGRPQAARIMLNVLRQIPFHGAAADQSLHDLEADPRWLQDRELVQVRSRMVTTDVLHTRLPTEAVLLQLLQANRRNRMAFDYLMAHYLLTRQPDKIVTELARLDDFGCATIPRHYAEAILLAQQLTGGPEVDLRGRPIPPQVFRRFQRFSEAFQRRVQETTAGREALARDFGDTFWHYYFLGTKAPTGPRSLRSTDSS